jgi:hypothetical protein
MKYHLKAFLKNEAEPYEVFNLTWYELGAELESLRQHHRKGDYDEVTSVEITPVKESK